MCGLLGFPSGELGPAVISRIGSKPEITMKTLILAAIRCSLMFTASRRRSSSVRPAQAYTVTLEQIGSNVVANGSGAINLTGLTFFCGNLCRTADRGKYCGLIRRGQPRVVSRRPCTLDSPDRRVSGAGSFFLPTLAAETLSAFSGACSGILSCHRAMSPVLLYRIA